MGTGTFERFHYPISAAYYPLSFHALQKPSDNFRLLYLLLPYDFEHDGWDQCLHWIVSAAPSKGCIYLARPWAGLRKHGITTIDELRAVSDRLERLEKIGPKTAWIVRQELARFEPP